ncbi:hypothetical protein B5S31_g2418 [[Candida] boidinii]|nr:hypothetical protein B5S31_g2418 [[Candida] boidinii]
MSDFADVKQSYSSRSSRGKSAKKSSLSTTASPTKTTATKKITTDETVSNKSSGGIDPNIGFQVAFKDGSRSKITKPIGDSVEILSPQGPMSEKQWNILIGYTCVRIISPIGLISHCLLLIYPVIKAQEYSLTSFDLITLFFPVLLNFMVASIFSKWFFKNNYYALRPNQL